MRNLVRELRQSVMPIWKNRSTELAPIRHPDVRTPARLLAMRFARIVHVVPAISEEASGPSYSVVRLVESLIGHGEDVALAVLDWAPSDNPAPYLRSFPLGIGPRRLGISPGMHEWLRVAVESGEVEIVHNHGMWQANSLYPGWACAGRVAHLVVSPRGALSSWAMSHGSLLKRIFWPLLQRPVLNSAACFHATCSAEYEDIRRLGFKQPVAIIPNGIDIASPLPKVTSELRTLLFLGRIHPKKGLDMLLAAWSRVQDEFPNWRLQIVGSDAGYHGATGYLSKLKAAAVRRRLVRLEFCGELRGQDKLASYCNADLFVLPTHSENFGMTVAEALAAGTPCVVTKGAPWAGLQRHHCGWWIEIGEDEMVACLMDSLARPRLELEAMGAIGRKWMLDEYSWDRIGSMMAETYRWLRTKGIAPPWIMVD